LTQVSVPGILTYPAPYALHDFTCALVSGFAAGGGRDGAGEFGLVSVCALASEPITTESATATAIAAAQSVERYRIALHSTTFQIFSARPMPAGASSASVLRTPDRFQLTVAIAQRDYQLSALLTI
jgi:hypothetical protein